MPAQHAQKSVVHGHAGTCSHKYSHTSPSTLLRVKTMGDHPMSTNKERCICPLSGSSKMGSRASTRVIGRSIALGDPGTTVHCRAPFTWRSETGCTTGWEAQTVVPSGSEQGLERARGVVRGRPHGFGLEPFSVGWDSWRPMRCFWLHTEMFRHIQNQPST